MNKHRTVLLSVGGAALVGLCVAYGGMFPGNRGAGKETKPRTLHGAPALEQLKYDGQYESLQAAMNQARFSVTRTAHSPLGRGAWHAPNPAASYDGYVTEEGVSIAVNAESYVSLSLHSFGYGAALQPVKSGEISGDRQTITITRDGDLREWYVNGPDGLEQGFTLSEPPGERQQEAPLRLALQVSAGWRAIASQDGKAVTLRGADGQAVEYGKLVASDSLGRNVPSRLTVAEEQVVIEVEDHEAAYPLTIDPLFTLQQKLTATDGKAFEYFGHAVALSGNTALVGAPYDEDSRGAAFVFVRNGGSWTQQARLLGQDGVVQDYFGWSVALDGDTALVGTLYGPGSANADQGAAYVFVRTGTTWTQQKKLTANDGQAFALFGTAVALDGDTALVGAPDHQIIPASVNTGAAFVFVRNGPAWTQQARLEANDAGGGDRFGEAVALEGDTALVGAPKDDVGTNTDQGSAYLFRRNGTSWTQQPRLNTTPAPGDHFGNAVALSGGKALIGAYLYGSDDSGAMFTFRHFATGWKQTDRTIALNPTAGAHFGVSLALSGDMAVVGASLGLFETGVDQRCAYVFEVSSDPELVRQLGPEVGTADDRFGYAVALDGDTVIVGAYRGDAADTDQGAVYTFVLHDSRHVEQQKLFANDGALDDHFGDAVALSGNTLAVGVLGDDIGTNADQGSVYVFTRTGTVWTFQQKLIANDGAAGDQFGYAVSLSGDTLAVGANLDDVGTNSAQGSAYVFTRTDTIWTFQQNLTANDGDREDYFGAAVALNGDTLVVGAPMDTVGNNGSQGSAYVFTRNGVLWGARQRLTANDGAAFDEFGYAVAVSGDTVVVGAYNDTIGTNAVQGSAYVFARNATGWAFQQKLAANDGAPGDNFGSAVALNVDTVVVGAPNQAIGGNMRQGSAYVFTRTGTTWAQWPKLIASDGAANDSFGSAVALSGDTLVLGARGDNIGTNTDQGSAYVYTRIGGWFEQQKLTAGDGAPNDFFGTAVALSGDTVLVGASSDNIDTNNNQGSAYVFVSPGCPTLTINPASLPVGRLGLAYNQQLDTTGGSVVGDYQFTVSSGVLPPGLTLDLPGLLHGTPTATGTYRFTITTTFFLSGCPGSRSYTLRITPPCSAITVNPVTPSAAFQGRIYSQTLTATGGEAPYGFAVTAGALPPGLSLSAEGVVSGTPTQPGSFPYTITATDANACVGTRAYMLGVGCLAVIVKPDTLPAAKQGAPYSQSLAATGGAAPYRYTISNSQLPTELSLSTAGVLSGTPTQAGTFEFTVSVQDAGVCAAVQGFALVVNECRYTLTPTGQSFAAREATGELTVTTDGECPWTASSNAPWLTITGGTNGTGNGRVTYTVAANTGAARQAIVTVAGQTHQVQQADATSETLRLTRLAPNTVRMGTDGLILDVIGNGFATSQLVKWNGSICETSFESATRLRALIPAALLSSEGNATVMVADTANGAQSNTGKFRVVGAVAHASAASYNTITLAPDSIVAAFGTNLATEVRSAESSPLPTELAGTTVTVRDSEGTAKRAPLFFVAPNQVNYLMPPGLANGVATVTITNGHGLAVESLTEISAVAPGLFSANASGEGAAAALVLRIRDNGEQVYEPVARYDVQTQTFVLVPIDLSNAAEQVYLILFGTGIRLRGALEEVTIKLGETELPVSYAGAAPSWQGLDQVNVLLRASLRGRGEQTVVLRINDQATNGVKVHFQ